VAWFSRAVLPSGYAPSRGWAFSPHWWLDIWGRWDSGWYFSIVANGYTPIANAEGQRNTAFSPLYPYLVRLIHNLFIPKSVQTPGTVLLVAAFVSNVAFLAALTLLYTLIVRKWNRPAVARAAVIYLCVYPTSFIFSSFYTESLYLFLSLAMFHAAERRKWLPAGLIGGLATLTRSVGVMGLIPLGILFLKKERRLKWNLLWLGLIPLGLLIYGFLAYQVTGDPFEIRNVHKAWEENHMDWPWHALFFPHPPYPYMQQVDQVMTLLFIGLSILSLRCDLGLGTWALLNLLVPLTLTNLISMTRFISVVFPAFVVLADWGERWPWLHQAVLISFAILLGGLMVLWARFYWVV